jgi:hypothetical protein
MNGEPAVPVTPGSDDIVARLRQLETRVDELSRGTLSNAVISSGGITIRDLGGIELIDRDGETVFFVGGAGEGWARPDGTPQPITSISDDRGRWRIAVFDPNPNERGYRQFVAVWDYNGNLIFGDDADSGEGLARPYIPLSVSRARWQEWPATTSTGWEALEKIRLTKQHPQLDAHIRCTTSDENTSGEFRLRDFQADIVIGQTHTFGYAEELRTSRGPVPSTWSDTREIWLEARRTTGTGDVRATVAYAAGVQT